MKLKEHFTEIARKLETARKHLAMSIERELQADIRDFTPFVEDLENRLEALQELNDLADPADLFGNEARQLQAADVRKAFIEDALDSGIDPVKLLESIVNRTDAEWWIRNRDVLGIVPLMAQLTRQSE